MSVLVKISLNFISFSPITLNLGESEKLGLWENRKEWVFPLNHSNISYLNFQVREYKEYS